MKQITFVLLLALMSATVSAQYVYYRDKKLSYVQEDRPAGGPARQPVEKKTEKPARKEMNTVYQPDDLNILKEEPKEKVYKTYPDKCPGVAGSIPWCLSYVPPMLITILVDRYEGYLMTIKGVIQQGGETLYYLQVCRNGQMVTEYSKEDGTQVTK